VVLGPTKPIEKLKLPLPKNESSDDGFEDDEIIKELIPSSKH